MQFTQASTVQNINNEIKVNFSWQESFKQAPFKHISPNILKN